MSEGVALARLSEARSRVVGASQTAKAIARGSAVEAFFAADADSRVTDHVVQAAAEHGVPLVRVESMAALGKACGIAVGAAAAAVLS